MCNQSHKAGCQILAPFPDLSYAVLILICVPSAIPDLTSIALLWHIINKSHQFMHIRTVKYHRICPMEHYIALWNWLGKLWQVKKSKSAVFSGLLWFVTDITTPKKEWKLYSSWGRSDLHHLCIQTRHERMICVCIITLDGFKVIKVPIIYWLEAIPVKLFVVDFRATLPGM